MNDTESKSNAPILIIVICAGFTMVVNTIAAAIKIMGYDVVIQADAKARSEKILQGENKLTPELQDRFNLLQEQVDSLKLDSHKPQE